MERLQKPQDRRERTGIVQIVLIAAVLLAALYGGLRLLGATHAAWEERNAQRHAKAQALQRASNQALEQEHARVQLQHLQEVRRQRQEYEEAIRDGRLRCINGQLFRRLPNGWESVPSERCLN